MDLPKLNIPATCTLCSKELDETRAGRSPVG
jgi:hypothetical protein